MKITNSSKSIIAYLESLVVNKAPQINVSKDNLVIILDHIKNLEKDNSDLKGFIIGSNNSKNYSIWRKNR